MIFLWNRFYYENEWNYVGFNHQNEFLINKLMEDNLKILIIFYFEKKNMKNVGDTRQCNFWLL